MKQFQALILMIFAICGAAAAQSPNGELTKFKERELEEVRERISDLKKSMDKSAAERDRLTGELQDAEVAISEQRQRIRNIEREQRFAEKKKAGLDADLAEREAHLDLESTELALQVRAAYMSGSQEKIKLLLNQRDPATLGRLMAYYRYLSDYRADNIAAVSEEIRKLVELRAQIAAETARLTDTIKN
jgi:septal ring factor EnvC (AmiA/AmiB activator)